MSAASPDAVFDVVADLRAHLEWSGERASDETFKLLTLKSPDGIATVGTGFTSTGANYNGVFSDRSIVVEVSRPRVFVIHTDARLDRKHGRPWHAYFEHRYDIELAPEGTKITYTETIDRVNYVPYWLMWWARPVFRPLVNRADNKQLNNLARLAEERARTT